MAEELVYQLVMVNFVTLDGALRLALGINYGGLSVGGENVRVHLADGVIPDDVRPQVDAVIAAHDPAVLTAEQQVAADREAERVRLYALPWTDWTAADKEWLLEWVAVQLGVLPGLKGEVHGTGV